MGDGAELSGDRQEIRRNLDFLQTLLRDLPSRQRSLAAAFDHSWRLLTSEEQAALSRLAVFRGGFERAAAEQVAETSLPVLLALASKSLIRRAESGRYDLHEVVRQYALAHLAEMPAHDLTCDRHSRFYLALLEGREPVLRSGAQRQTLRALRDEIDNLRSASDWAVARGFLTPSRRPCAALVVCSSFRAGWRKGSSCWRRRSRLLGTGLRIHCRAG